MSYQHLNIYERINIYVFIRNGFSIREIAKTLHRNPSTISREINRNKEIGEHSYLPNDANNRYLEKRTTCHRKRIVVQKVLSFIKSKIEKHWSLDQIYNRSKIEGDEIPSTSTIYRMIHDKRICDINMEKLRRKGKFKRPSEKRGKFNVSSSRLFKNRPKEVFNRQEIGHWEGDTVESGRIDRVRKSNTCFVTLAERKSRVYIAIKVPSRESKHVTPAIISALKEFPKELIKTITFDRGKEFSGYKEIEEELKVKTYFCDLYCARQKGTNENSNGLIREFYPKGMDLSQVDLNDLNNVLKELNDRPRRCLNYKTPNEVMFGT